MNYILPGCGPHSTTARGWAINRVRQAKNRQAYQTNFGYARKVFEIRYYRASLHGSKKRKNQGLVLQRTEPFTGVLEKSGEFFLAGTESLCMNGNICVSTTEYWQITKRQAKRHAEILAEEEFLDAAERALNKIGDLEI